MIKAIETQYKGYRFRSRLEARWAVFFDALGLRWEYEPEGFDLGGAGWYLPDFKVEYPGRNASERHHEWFEVKADAKAITAPEWTKMLAFQKEAGLVLLDGTPDMRMYCDPEWFLDKTEDSTQFKRFGQSLFCMRGRMWADHHDTFFDHEPIEVLTKLRRAVEAARSARFEHGEGGASWR